MKKSLFFVAAATLVLASCNNDVKIDENVALEGSNAQKEIALTPYAQKAKRALDPGSEKTPVVEDATYPDNLVMQVAAYAMHGASSSWDAVGYFDKTSFKGTDAGNWKGDPTKRYWPLSDAYISFLAVAGVPGDDVTSMGDPYASGAIVKYTATSFGAQTDLMYSGKQASVTKSGNTLVFPPDVDMTFKHALALVKFNVRAASDAYDEKFAITKIVINDAVETGTFTITNTGYNTVGDPTPTGVWGNSPQTWTVADYDVTSSSIAAGYLTTAYQACGKALLVPKAEGAFAKFTIYYTLDGKAFTFDYTPDSRVLAQATKYVYNITFKLTEIEIDPVVTAWTDGGTEYVEIPANPMAYSTNYSVVATADAQILKFKINGFTAASGNKYKVTVGGTDAAAVTATTPSDTGADLPGTSAAVTATIAANESGADKTFTLTIQEVTSADVNVGTATVITVTQAH